MASLNKKSLAIASFTAIIIFAPLSGLADEYDSFIHAKNAYDAGEYEEAVARFDKLIADGLSNTALALECRKLIAVSCLFVGDREKAQEHFAELLTLAPEYNLDPMLFPIEVIDFFTEVKTNNQERLHDLARARAEEEARRLAEEEARRNAELERLKRNVYLERSRRQNSLLVAFMPFGAGQFQNGHIGRGVFFLTGEILLTAGAVTTYFLHESLRPQATEPFSSPDDRREAEKLEAGLRIANQATLVALGAVAVAGIIDSLYNFERETVVWKQIEEDEVPKKLRPGKGGVKATLAPRFGVGSVGFELRGRF